MVAWKDFSFIQLIGMSGEGVFIASHSDAPPGKSETVVTADSHPACAVNGELTTCPGPRSQDYMTFHLPALSFLWSSGNSGRRCAR